MLIFRGLTFEGYLFSGLHGTASAKNMPLNAKNDSATAVDFRDIEKIVNFNETKAGSV